MSDLLRVQALGRIQGIIEAQADGLLTPRQAFTRIRIIVKAWKIEQDEENKEAQKKLLAAFGS